MRETYLQQIVEQGYAVLENAVETDLIDALHDDVLRQEEELGIKPSENDFEGTRTLRTHNLLSRGPLYERIPVHPSILPLVDLVLGPGGLLSMMGAIDIGPGETAQPLHADDQTMPIARPHRPMLFNAMWALTDFTEENGATRVVPGSHLADHFPTAETYDAVPVEMARGSVLVFNGSLWHGGGANRSAERRIGISAIYCAGFLRQEENQQLGIPRETVRSFPPRLRELVGYGVYMGVLGHIEKHSPADLLLTDPGSAHAYETSRHENAAVRALRGLE